jgi:hypothetical protein
MIESKKLNPAHFGYRKDNPQIEQIFHNSEIFWVSPEIIVIKSKGLNLIYNVKPKKWTLKAVSKKNYVKEIYSSPRLSIKLFKRICKENGIKL